MLSGGLSTKGSGQGSHQERSGSAGGGLHLWTCEYTSVFYKDRARQLPGKAPSTIINLEGLLESSIKKGWSILQVTDQTPLGICGRL